MRVWIVSPDYGEGLSEPEAVFSTEEKALEYLKTHGGSSWGIHYNLTSLDTDLPIPPKPEPVKREWWGTLGLSAPPPSDQLVNMMPKFYLTDLLAKLNDQEPL